MIIPATRLINWSPGVNVGIPGGITRALYNHDAGSKNAIDDYGAVGNGTANDTEALFNTIRFTTPGQVAYLPAGTYNLTRSTYANLAQDVNCAHLSGVTIRGAGMGKTILRLSVAGRDGIRFGSGGLDTDTALTISSGATRNSMAVTVPDASSIAVGRLARIAHDDTGYVVLNDASASNNRIMSVIMRITAVIGNVITFEPALPIDMTGNPTIAQFSSAPGVGNAIEDLTIDGNGTAASAIFAENQWNFHTDNVEIKNMGNRQLYLVAVQQSEFRRLYTHDVAAGGPNHEGIDFYSECCWNLVVDSICHNGGFPSIILGDSRGGCVGNVFLGCYEAAVNTGTGGELSGAGISLSHGGHNMFNLVEACLAENGIYNGDGYYGSTSHNTLLRNWFPARHPSATENLFAIAMMRWSNYHNTLGNILGDASFVGNFLMSAGAGYTPAVIYKLGLPNIGNNNADGLWGPSMPPNYRTQYANGNGGDGHGSGGLSLQEVDQNVAATSSFHGNFDYFDGEQKWETTDTNVIDHTDHSIPGSLCHAARPAWVPTGFPWPPIDPANPPGTWNAETVSAILPAAYAFHHQDENGIPQWPTGAPAPVGARLLLRVATNGDVLVSGAGDPAIDGRYLKQPTLFNTKRWWALEGTDPAQATQSIIWHAVAHWSIQDADSGHAYTATDDTAYPWQASEWVPSAADPPAPTVVAA